MISRQFTRIEIAAAATRHGLLATFPEIVRVYEVDIVVADLVTRGPAEQVALNAFRREVEEARPAGAIVRVTSVG